MSPKVPNQVRIPAAIWVLGLVSMLMDISSEMVHSLLPMFMVGALGASALAVGLIEGLAEATALIVKVFSGVLSDYLGRRKGLAVLGYTLGACSKPLFAMASSAGLVLGARLIDRVGKGIRGAPRDALVADIAPPALRGAAIGLRQSLDTVGAFLGPLLGVLLMLLWANDFRAVFWVAVVPGLLAVALLLLGVQEPQQQQPSQRRSNPVTRANLARMGAAYWRVVAVGAVCTLARFSEAFLVLRAQQTGVATAPADLRGTAYGFFNLVSGVALLLASATAGWLWDRHGAASTFYAGAAFCALALLVLLWSQAQGQKNAVPRA